MYHTYILYSEKLAKYYIGHTGDDLEQRLRRHNSHHKGFTGGIGDWIIVYTEAYELRKAAAGRERQIKSWKSSIRIRQLVAGSAGSAHPD